jgi:hypothetical protein
MHNCEEFRERITEHIIDREDIAANAEFQHELLMCPSCSEFCAESREMMEALSEIELTISDSQWSGIQHRLHARILNEPVHDANLSNVVARFSPRLPAVALVSPPRVRIRDYVRPLVLATAAALLVVTMGLSRLTVPVTETFPPADPTAAVYVEHSVPLDPVTVDFLEESELLLRSVMKIEPADVEDLADARKVASEQLAELGQRKEAAAEVPVVVGVMETYETVLRDLRNVDERSADEDISDIQRRIQKNGLIANMKAFQPRVTEVSFGLR